MRLIDADHLKRWILSRVFKAQLSVADVIDQIDREDTIEPECKTGEWNWVGFNIECSECGFMPNFDSTEPLYNFCPNCGADMRGRREE